MELSILTLNCQKNYNQNLKKFIQNQLSQNNYDIYLLQEATEDVLKHFEIKNYTTLTNIDKEGRLSLPALVYNSNKLTLKTKKYIPFLVDSIERKKHLKQYQSFGILKAEFKFFNKKITVGSIHLPSGFDRKLRNKNLKIGKEFMIENLEPSLKIFGGDCNFCLPFEIRNAQKAINNDFKIITRRLGKTLDSFYTETGLDYSWVKMNDFFRKIKINPKFKTDHIFLDNDSFTSLKYFCKILNNRVSDHSPVEFKIKL